MTASRFATARSITTTRRATGRKIVRCAGEPARLSDGSCEIAGLQQDIVDQRLRFPIGAAVALVLTEAALEGADHQFGVLIVLAGFVEPVADLVQHRLEQ